MGPMFSFNRTGFGWFLKALTVILFPALTSVCTAQGFAHVEIDSIASTRTPYTYVFSGLVTCQNRPCANVRVDVDLVTNTQGAIVQSTRTGADGRYQLEVTVSGSPEDSSLWKIEAHTTNLSQQESAQAEGRVILMDDEQTVVVDRSLLLIQA